MRLTVVSDRSVSRFTPARFAVAAQLAARYGADSLHGHADLGVGELLAVAGRFGGHDGPGHAASARQDEGGVRCAHGKRVGDEGGEAFSLDGKRPLALGQVGTRRAFGRRIVGEW